MFGRAVTAFRKGVIKSKSSTTISDKDEDFDGCNESIVSTTSLSIGSSHDTERSKRASIASNSVSRLLLSKRQRRSQSANREGDI